MRYTRIKPDIENAAVLSEFVRPARTFGAGGQKRFLALPPGIGSFLAEFRNDVVAGFFCQMMFVALDAFVNDDGHPPNALARQAPIGAVFDHAVNALGSPGGNPPHSARYGLQRFFAQIFM